jgi:hypothetical protein
MALASLGKTIVVYMVNPTESQSTLKRVCEKFHKLFEAYATALRATNNPSDVVLQIIPLHWVGYPSQLTIPSPQQCTRLANVIYNRCPLVEGTSSAYASGSLLQLTDRLPTSVEFRPSPSNNTHPLKHDEGIHLAYHWSEEAHWLSAAFIDNIGSKQWNASYYLGESLNPWPYFAAIAREIWEVVKEATNAPQRDCKIFIAKTHPFNPMEIEGECYI